MSAYETDILLWSEQQAALLRRRAAGELINEAELDWDNIAAEIESLGSEQRYQVESLLLQAMLHRLKAQAWPASLAVPHWESEARVFLRSAQRRYVPSMRHRIDLPGLYLDAVDGLPESIDGQLPSAQPPDACPWTLKEILVARPRDAEAAAGSERRGPARPR